MVRNYFQKQTKISDVAKQKPSSFAQIFVKDAKALRDKAQETEEKTKNSSNNDEFKSEIQKINAEMNQLNESARRFLETEIEREDLIKTLSFLREKLKMKVKVPDKSKPQKNNSNQYLNFFDKISYNQNYTYASGYSFIDADIAAGELWGSSWTEGFCEPLYEDYEDILYCRESIVLADLKFYGVQIDSQWQTQPADYADVYFYYPLEESGEYCIEGQHSVEDWYYEIGYDSSDACINIDLPTQLPEIASVEFEEINSSLDENPGNGVSGTAIGKRIYPEKSIPTDTVDRTKVRVKATLTQAQQDVSLYFKVFDLDDPSANTAPIDPNGSAGNDNATNGGFPAEGQLSSELAITDNSGVASVELTVSKQPGNNFAVAVSKDSTYLNNITVDGIELKNGSQTIPLSGPTTASNPAVRTEMLTVWRKLHIENDSMGTASGNNVTGTVSSTVNIPAGNPSAPSTVTLPLNVTPSLEINRFENGRIEIGSRSFRVFDSTDTVTANTADTVTITNTAGAYTVNSGDAFTLYDDDDFNENNAGNLVGDFNEDIAQADTTMISDTDTPCTATVDTNCNSFAPAYIRPVYDLSGSNENIPYSVNTPETDRANIYNNYFNNRSYANADFWAVYLLGVYQPEVIRDSDPDESDATYGRVDSLMGVGAFVYIELNRAREYEDLDSPGVRVPGIDVWRNRPVGNKYTTAHEIGHLLNGDHDDCDTGISCNTPTNDSGLMAQTSYRIRKIFTNTSIHKFRNVNNP